MQEIINNILQIFSLNSDAIMLAAATGIAAVMVFAIKYIFLLASVLTKKTATKLDEKLLQKIKDVFKNKIKDI